MDFAEFACRERLAVYCKGRERGKCKKEMGKGGRSLTGIDILDVFAKDPSTFYKVLDEKV